MESHESGVETGVAVDVLSQVAPGAETVQLSEAIREALTDPVPMDLRSGVFEALGLREESDDVGAVLREIVCDHEAPDLADSVMAELGLGDQFSLGELLGPDSQPDLWAGIAEKIGPEEKQKAEPESSPGVLSFTEERERRSMGYSTGILWAAAAAALLFVFMGGDKDLELEPRDGDVVASQESAESVSEGGDAVAELNSNDSGSDLSELAQSTSDEVSSPELEQQEGDVVIEDIDSDANAFVQVFQFEEDAPPIIFITELEEGFVDDTEGATL